MPYAFCRIGVNTVNCFHLVHSGWSKGLAFAALSQLFLRFEAYTQGILSFDLPVRPIRQAHGPDPSTHRQAQGGEEDRTTMLRVMVRFSRGRQITMSVVTNLGAICVQFM